jgi:hypothetical protein
LANENQKLANIRLGIALLFKPGQLIELRAFRNNGKPRGVYYDDHEALAKTVERLDSDPRITALYYVINAVKPNLPKTRGLPVNPNDAQVDEIIDGAGSQLTSNDDVETLNWLFIDVDTNRAAGFEHEPSSKEEKKATQLVAKEVLKTLEEKGWPQPLLGDSGNGYHILAKINMMNTPHNVHLLVDCLKALAVRHDCTACHIDAGVFNPARLTRAYGSTTRKGTSTEERPYRGNRLYQPEAPIVEVTLDQILFLANDVPMDQRRKDGDIPELDDDADPVDWIEHFEQQGAFVIEEIRDKGDGMKLYITDYCLTAGHKHSGSDDKTGFIIGETFGWHCFSDDCEGMTIKDVFRVLREATNDDGTPKYQPYDKTLFKNDVQETFDELLAAGYIIDADKVEFAEENREEAELDLALDKEEPEPGVEPKVPTTLDSLDIKADKYATNLLAIMLHHNKETWQEGFIFYIKRVKEKLGYNAKYKKPSEGEVGFQTLSLPIGEVMRMLLKFVDQHRELPDKDAIKNFIDVSTDPEVRKNVYKKEMKDFIDNLPDLPASTFDDTANAFVHTLDLRQEVRVWRTAFKFFLLTERDILGGRTALKKHWNISTTQDTPFEQGSWQEQTEAVLADFEKNVQGVNDSRKCKLGFKTIDNSGANIGLDGDRYICICGPSNNRKSTWMLSVAMNLAIQGKNVLFFAGEHRKDKVLKKLTLQLSHFFREDESVGHIPGLSQWEGLNRTATLADVEKVKALLHKLRYEGIVPGHIEPQMQDAIYRGEEDKVGALLNYAEASYPKYQWDAIFIDPIDTVMPTEDAKGRANTFQLKADVIERLFQFSRNAFGGKGCMVFISAQFGSNAVRDVQRIQEKHAAGEERFDDELESILRRDGNIHSLTTIIEKCDLCIGVATIVKNGTSGLLVRGRDREGGMEWTVEFDVDKDSNYMTEKKRQYSKVQVPAEKNMAAAANGAFDEL